MANDVSAPLRRPPGAAAAAGTLLSELLLEQRQLTAVDRFAQLHDTCAVPARDRQYQALIPLTAPRPGEQFAFAVDLEACTGCKACVSACHALNGLDEDESWRFTGLLQGGTRANPYQQVITSACHHCLDPACLNGCPVLAYEKDPVTGVVRHLDDQCIGCQYCVLKCPYDVPQYSTRRGIVRKCDMCHGRLRAGEAPACVQACPSSAISVRLVSRTEVARESAVAGRRLLPGTFVSSYTQPTTRYHSRRPLPDNARPADADALRLEAPHWPLVWMLLLSQTAAGLFVLLAAVAGLALPAFTSVQAPVTGAAFLLLHLGLAASVFHLGRPAGAWRAFLGWRRSWMSREILAFALFAVLALWAGLMAWQQPGHAGGGWLSGGAAVAGVVSVFCSGMIYVDTQRPFWRASNTLVRFFGTTLLLGSAGAAALLGWTAAWAGGTAILPVAQAAAGVAAIVRTALFGWEMHSLVRALREAAHPHHRSARAMWRWRRGLIIARAALFVLSTASGLLAMCEPGRTAAGWATLSFIFTFGAQVGERHLFFVAVLAPRMPGGVPA